MQLPDKPVARPPPAHARRLQRRRRRLQTIHSQAQMVRLRLRLPIDRLLRIRRPGALCQLLALVALLRMDHNCRLQKQPRAAPLEVRALQHPQPKHLRENLVAARSQLPACSSWHAPGFCQRRLRGSMKGMRAGNKRRQQQQAAEAYQSSARWLRLSTPTLPAGASPAVASAAAISGPTSSQLPPLAKPGKAAGKSASSMPLPGDADIVC